MLLFRTWTIQNAKEDFEESEDMNEIKCNAKEDNAIINLSDNIFMIS
jgi:hypothetical protein